jgi:hypothetical protein
MLEVLPAPRFVPQFALRVVLQFAKQVLLALRFAL